MPSGLGNEDESTEKHKYKQRWRKTKNQKKNMRDGGRGAKGYHSHRPVPLAAEPPLPLTAGDDDDRHFPGH